MVPLETEILKIPSKFVIVPFVVPFSTTEAPIMGKPSSFAVIVPLILSF
jgi:hypothetical protein